VHSGEAVSISFYGRTEAELRWIPTNTVEVTEPAQARSLLKSIDSLEDLDYVQNVTANLEMSEQVMSLS
jgi:transcriptional/translational regulatory protein YebC/TACO1